MSNVEEHFLPVERTARYFTAGQLDQQTPCVWLVFHGYGQLASGMIRNFSTLADYGHYIIAPEGLSRFYWDGMVRQPGASWMTKEDRLHEIRDYNNYLSKLFYRFQDRFPAQASIHLLGFSQGVATAVRWFAHEKPSVDNLTVWAGEMPPDVDYNGLRPFLDKTKVTLVSGTEDQFISTDQMQQQVEYVKQYTPHVAYYTFEGKHRLDEDTLLTLANIQK